MAIIAFVGFIILGALPLSYLGILLRSERSIKAPEQFAHFCYKSFNLSAIAFVVAEPLGEVEKVFCLGMRA